ncbi:unnamed protein product [Albugo candida]|uniref:Protein kinase domain-containing protein n=1 Tax=Albugo candida TaxID=65357 RepID=A0A024FTG7_9STRA|nr:unnamed protein product [Albugo candida]|eukprot:CCI10403.1 unnamed protein product [Albugo candida]
MLKTLSSAVQTAVSGAVQGVIGEEFSKSYETPKDPTASGGHELVWKIFPAVSRKTNAEVSIFVFDKDDLVRKAGLKKKEDQERYLDILRSEIKTLRVLRHPHVLKVVEAFEESRRTLSFVTERVTCSLANACKNFNNVTNVLPEVLEIGLSEFEVACGMMHLGEALSFLHREGRRVHMSLGPHSVFITPSGEWKLGGMGFCRVVEPGQLSRSEYYGLGDEGASGRIGVKNTQTGVLEGLWEPPLQYCAPEIVTEPRQFSASADMFSLGLLLFELFVPPRADGGRDPVLDVRDGNRMSHAYKVQSLHPIHFPSSVPVSLQNTIRALLTVEPSQRPEARAFLASQFFDAGPVKTLRTLQTLVEQDPASQARFLTALPDQLEEFSPRTLRDMVIPALQGIVINKQVAPFTINPLLKIVKKVDKHTFMAKLAPMLIPLLAITEPVQCMLMFVSELEILIPKAEETYIRDHIVPMLCRSLDSTVPEILDTVLNKIVDQASLFEYRILKQVILPRVNKLILQPPQLSVRVNALLWLAKSFHVFDKDLLVESVIPTLSQTLQADKSPAVCMCILGCYDNLGKHLGPEFLAKYIIPAVTPLLWEKELNNQQFDCICEKIQDMLKCVISERDKMFMAEGSVKAISAGVAANSGFTSAITAAKESEEKRSGVAAANAMLSEEYVPAKSDSHGVRDDTNSRPGRYTDDPFLLKESTRNSGTRSTSDRKNDSTESIVPRRRAKNTARRRRSGTTGGTDTNLLDIDQKDGSGSTECNNGNLLASSTPPQGQPVHHNIFSNLNMGPANTATSMHPINQYSTPMPPPQAIGAQYPNTGMGRTGYPPPNAHLVPYGLQAYPQQNFAPSIGETQGQQFHQQQYAFPGGYQHHIGTANTGASESIAPGQLLQLQGSNNSGSVDPMNKFSAFDGL